jgi:hypothetical protein
MLNNRPAYSCQAGRAHFLESARAQLSRRQRKALSIAGEDFASGHFAKASHLKDFRRILAARELASGR